VFSPQLKSSSPKGVEDPFWCPYCPIFVLQIIKVRGGKKTCWFLSFDPNQCEEIIIQAFGTDIASKISTFTSKG